MALGNSFLLLLVLLAWSCYTALSWSNRIIYSNDINCDDDNETIRIFGSNPEQGMVQVCKNGLWQALCGTGWDCDNARVACRQLGFTEGTVVYYPYRYSRFGSWNYRENAWYQCNGTEESLSECKSRYTTCYRYNAAGIYCEEIDEEDETPECENDSVRLVDGNSSHEGRVEVCYNGTWSSLCSINTETAGVVCEKLGFSNHATVQRSGGIFGSSPTLGVTMTCDNDTKECLVSASSPSSCRSPSQVFRNCSTAIHCHLPCNSSEIRIAYGSTPNRGLFQKCSNGVWHAQCRSGWGCSQARAACRQLGYTGPLVYYPLYNSYSSNTYDSRYYYCRGNERNLSECILRANHYRYGYRYRYRRACSSTHLGGLYCNSLINENDTIECEENSVRLVGGQSKSEGRVEICYEGQWSSLCSVSQNAASTICTQLGLPNSHTTITGYYSPFGVSASIVNHVQCNASATTLGNCTIKPYEACTTSPSRTCSIGLKCHSLDFCKEGDIRLVDGDIDQEGRVEVCFKSLWTTICPNYRWDAIDGYVACKQLGYASVPQLYNFQLTRSDLRPTLTNSYINCVGYEERLADCYRNVRLNGYCYRSYRPAIRCFDDCTEGDIRLVNGPTKSEGTIEICHNRLWGVINGNTWSKEEARVVCRELGLPSQDAVALKNSYYGRPNLTTHYKYIECNGAEDRLTQCPKSSLLLSVGKTQFKSSGAAGVSCEGRPSKLPCNAAPPPTIATLGCTTDGAIRLSGGRSSNEGRLEYCHNGQWSPFCTLRAQEATVACNELGFTRAIWASVFTDGRFGETTSYSRFQNITCSDSASERALRDCELHETSCLPVCNNIGIRCYDPIKCKEGSVRLQDGVIEQEGRVEVCTNGVWGSVCDQLWNDTEAFVVCKQVGRAEQKAVAYRNSYFGDGNGPISYSRVSCGGWEEKLTDCSTKKYPSFSCSREQIAGVLCGDDCHDGDVQLVGGNSSLEGTVQICFNNIWGLISESGWGSFDAAVVCNQLGFLNRGAVAYGGSRFGKPNMTIQASEVTCDGDEKVLDECGLTTYSLVKGKALINKVEVAGVSCQPCPPGVTGCSPVIRPTQTPPAANPFDRFDGVQPSTLSPLYAVIGIMAATIAAAIAVLIILSVLIRRKWIAYNKQLADLNKVPEKTSVYTDVN